MRKVFAAIIAAAVVAFGFATLAPRIALAHTGNVHATETCDGWSASVNLDNNVTSNRTVTVVTTIPGTVGLTGHYNTTGASGETQIWDASGPGRNVSGTVTLYIDFGQQSEFTASASLP